MKFVYKKEPCNPSDAFPAIKHIYRPIIPITLEFESRKIGYEALLDSGADWNLFHSIIGEAIGVTVEKGKKISFRGIGGGDFTAYFHTLTVTIGGWPYTMYCGFSSDIPMNSKGVLGHSGFFDSFMVKFNTPKLEVELTDKK